MLDLSFFKENGYQVIRELIPEDLVLEATSYLRQEKKLVLEKINYLFPFHNEQDLSNQIAKLSDDKEEFELLSVQLKQWLSGHYPLETRLSEELLNIIRTPIVSELYGAIFPNEDPKVHLPPTARFVLPKYSHAAVPPHQDVSYNKHMDDFFVMWTPFTPTNSVKGGVDLFPNTHKLSHKKVDTNEGFWLQGLEINVPPIHFDMNLGDVLLMDPYIVHRSRPNLSNETRISGDFRFFSGISTKHYLNIKTGKRVAPLTDVATSQH